MTETSLLLQRFTEVRALVIGDAMLDSYVDGEAERLCREGPVPVVRKQSEQHFPGGAANTAANLRALGAEVSFLSLVGQDGAGERLRAELRQRGIHDEAVIASPAVATLHKQRILANGQYVVRVDAGELKTGKEIAVELQERLLEALERCYPACNLVVISDYSYGVLCPALIARLRELQEEQPRVMLVDSKHLENLRTLRATVVTPNYGEARQLVGLGKPPDEDDGRQASQEEVETLGRKMLALLASEHVAVTLGARGVFLMDRQERTHLLPAYPVTHANDVGAGDSFASAMALALAAGASIEEAARVGIEAACVAVAKPRTALVHADELQQRFAQRAEVLAASSSHKRKSLDELARIVERARQNGQTIVFTNGVFDLLHFGHIRLLSQAKKLGDILVVGLNSDESARRLKGQGRPITGQYERLALIEALDAVDYALLFDEETPEQLIRRLRPDYHVKGGDYVDRPLPEAQAVAECGGRVVIIPREGDKSTSKTIERIAAASHAPASPPGPSGQSHRSGGGA